MERDETMIKMAEYQTELAALIDRRTGADGAFPTAIPALSLMRATKAAELEYSVYEPSLCVVAQGSKIVMMAEERYQYDLSSYLVTSVQLPVSGMVIEATPHKPHLCLKICFTMSDILDILGDSDQCRSREAAPERAIYVNRLGAPLLDAVLRLVRLLDTPRDIPALSPLVLREILYRVLQDEHGDLIKRFAVSGSTVHRVAKAIRRLNENCAEPLRVEALAREVGMSVSALYSQFKKVTAMSPLQYKKQLRLQKARRLLLTEDLDAATAAFQVGYESPSQFSREYARLFGRPPLRDIRAVQSGIAGKE